MTFLGDIMSKIIPDLGIGVGTMKSLDKNYGCGIFLEQEGYGKTLLTDTDGQYVEYQAGRLYVQYFPGEENPISQATFDPHLTDQWTEVWFPVKEIGGIKEASQWGAMNVVETATTLEIKINAFKASTSSVVLQSGGKRGTTH
jgi:hypothetical protein